MWCRIYQSNFHNIKNQFSAQAFGLKPGVLWPASARFGLNLAWFSALTPRHIVPVHLWGCWISRFNRNYPPPRPRKFLGSVQAVASKSDFMPPRFELPLWGPHLSHENQTPCTWRDLRTCTRHHAEAGEMTNYPLCERALCEAVRRHIVQMGRDSKLIAVL